MNRISVKALALSVGIAWAVCVFAAAITASFGWGNTFVFIMSSIYLGYGSGFAGGIIGAIWAFVDGFVGGLIVGLLYNKFSK